jgi:Fe-S cluster assembly iron-binding protein IscA
MTPMIRNSFLLLVLLSLSCRPASPPSSPPPSGEEVQGEPIIVLTEGAVKQVFRYRDLHKLSGKWRLRVEVIELPGGKCRHLVDLDVDPTNQEDFEYDFQGVRIVVARSQISRLRGSSVGYRKMEDGTEGFFVHNPNYPLNTAPGP